jgi:hypothetical protein
MTNKFSHRYLFILSLVSVLLLGAIFLPPIATAESGDTSGPVVQDFELSSDSFEAGETMEIEVDAADKSDIARLYFRYEHTDGGGAVYDAYRDFEPAVENGTYTIEYQWPEDTPAGTYEVSYVSAEDSIGNRRTYHDDIPGKEQVTIESDLTDTTGPIVESFELSGESFEAGETMEIDVTATDATGITRLYFRYEHTDGGGAVYDAYRDFEPAVENGTYTIEYQWPEDTPEGTYEISYVSAEDSIGNRRTYFDNIRGKEQVAIGSDLTDTEGPNIESFELSDDLFDSGETMEIDVTATDTTGIARLYFRYEHTDGGGAVYDAYRDFEPAVEDGTYTIEYQWPEDTPEGTYEISYVSAEDSIGNRRTYHDDIPGKEQVVIGSSSEPSDEESVQENEEGGTETEHEENEVSDTEAEQEDVTGQESRENDEAADSESVQENKSTGREVEQSDEGGQEVTGGPTSGEAEETTNDTQPRSRTESQPDTSRSVVDAVLDALSDLFTASTLDY